MKKEEAKFILGSYRHGGQDGNDPHFREALALAKSDPELSKWFEEELALEAEVSRKVHSIPVPSNLRSNILAGRKLVRPDGLWQRRGWFSLVASLLVLLSVLVFWFQRPAASDFAKFETEMTEFLTSKLDGLDFQTEELGEIRAWLAAHGSSDDFVLPERLAELQGLGCRLIDWRGNLVTLICFTSGSDEVHLLVMDRSALRHPPGRRPQFGQSGTWATAAWSDQDKVYMLSAEGNGDLLAELL
jgi:hypothetical protein